MEMKFVEPNNYYQVKIKRSRYNNNLITRERGLCSDQLNRLERLATITAGAKLI